MKSALKKLLDKEILILIATCLEIGSYGVDLYDALHQLI